MKYEQAAVLAAIGQMPLAPESVLQQLPVDGDPAAGPTLCQTGGWVMVIRYGNYGLDQPDLEQFLVASSDESAQPVYEGPSWADAWAALIQNGAATSGKGA